MSRKIFHKECINRGFVRYKSSYMRVVGDGVFQHILPDFKERLHSSASNYSQRHRYESRILIYLKSMYARYDGAYISIDNTTGFSLTVPLLLDKQDTPFMGAEVEMERMLNGGLDVLDSIRSQRQLIEHLEPKLSCHRDEPWYSTQLYDMYLFCEDFYKARKSIETEFAEKCFANIGLYKKDPNMFSDKIHCFLDSAESYYERHMLTFPVHYDAAKQRLRKNYEINSRRLKELGISCD